MLKQYGFNARLKRIHVNLRPYLSSPIALSAGLIILGAGLLFAFTPSNDGSAVTTAAADNPSMSSNADETQCDRQAWPYKDQRCITRQKAAQGSRQVRIVTDKGTSVTTAAPLPIIEKSPASPARPAIAQAAPKIGPTVIPAVDRQSTEAQPADVTSSEGTKAMASAANPPSSASSAPPPPRVEAFDDTPPKSKSKRVTERAERRALEKAQKREARQIKRDRDNGVPDEVIAAVEEAAGELGARVSVESPRGRRVYVVPRDGDEW